MSGSLDNFDVYVECSGCGVKNSVNITQDIDYNRKPETIEHITNGPVECGLCGDAITDDDL